MIDPLSLIPKEAYVASRTGKFESKLTFEQRCTVLALVTAGIARPIIAAAFSVDRRTVTHIVNHSGVHYRNVRNKLKELGKEEFIKTYIGEMDAIAIKEAAQRVQDDLAHPQSGPSARATGHAGIQVVKPVQCAYSHRLEIGYVTVDGTTGWHYRDLDSKHGNAWLHNGDASLLTSAACLKAAEANLLDD